jgi:hypothetical protein
MMSLIQAGSPLGVVVGYILTSQIKDTYYGVNIFFIKVEIFFHNSSYSNCLSHLSYNFYAK